MNILQIDSSPQNSASVTRELTAAVVEGLRAQTPSAHVEYLDLVVSPPDHLTYELVQVVKFGKHEGLDARQQSELALTHRLVEQFLAADVIVMGAPMYNFSVPTQLKAWIDRLAQPGRTFKYTEKGPVGLAGGRRLIIVSSRGGKYAGMAHEQAMDHQEAYLKAVFGFFGVTDVTIIRAEGTAMGPEARAAAIAAARAQISEMAQPLAA